MLRLGVVLLGVVVGALLVEVGLRLIGVSSPERQLRELHVAEPERPWLYRMRPSVEARIEQTGDVVYRTNEDRFRGSTYPRLRQEGSLRILVLGDSITFGYGVSEEETYPALLEQRLARRTGSRVEVLNHAVSGYNPYNEAALFREIGAEYAPDIVLAQFCINDLNDPTLHFDAQTRLALGAIPEEAFPDPTTRGETIPARSSPLGFCRFLHLCRALERAVPWGRDPSPDARSLVLAMRPREALAPGPVRDWLRRQYTDISEHAAGAGARFAVIAFPHSGQLSGSDRIQRDLVALGEEAGWRVFDLLPAFRLEGKHEGDLYLDLWHPSAAGHRVAAAELERQLVEAGWVALQ